MVIRFWLYTIINQNFLFPLDHLLDFYMILSDHFYSHPPNCSGVSLSQYILHFEGIEVYSFSSRPNQLQSFHLFLKCTQYEQLDSHRINVKIHLVYSKPYCTLIVFLNNLTYLSSFSEVICAPLNS